MESQSSIADPAKDKDSKFQVEAQVTYDKETGEPLFNGMSRSRIIGYPFYQLNYYQMACKPRLLDDVPTQDQDEDDYINLELFDQLKDTLQCLVCSDIYQHPVNVKPCLHKFCNNCIEAYNRKFKKECPGCRQPIGSRRQLRSDYKIQNIISALISNIDEYNKYEQIKREEIVREQHDFEGLKQKMMKIHESQEMVLQQERLDKHASKYKRKREEHKERNQHNIDSDNEQQNQADSQVSRLQDGASSQHLRNIFGVRREQKLAQKKKQIRLIDEDVLKNIDVEFILRQETQRKNYIKEKIFMTQLIRTTEKVKMIQLKKLISQKIGQQLEYTINDIQLHIYTKQGDIKLANDQTIQDIVESKNLCETKVKMMLKKETSLIPNPKNIETIWVAISNSST